MTHQLSLTKTGNTNTFNQWAFPLWLQGLILFFISILITGYTFYYDNQAITVPLVQWINDPELFPGDPFVSTLIHYAAPIWRLVALFARFISIETLLLILFLFTRAFILFASAQLAMAIEPGNKLGAVGSMAFFTLWPISLIAHGTLISNYFEQTSLAVAFMLLSFASFYLRNRYSWAIWSGISFTINSMYGVYACTYFAAALLLDAQYRRELRKWIGAFAVLGLITLPTLIISINALSIDTSLNELWLLASKARFPMHLYPHTWNPLEILVFIGFMICSICLLFINRHKKAHLYTLSIILTLVCLGWFLATFIAAYFARSPTLLILHPGRATDVWFAFISIAIIALIAYIIGNDFRHKPIYIFLFFTSILWQKIFDHYLLIIPLLLMIALLAFWRPTMRSIFKNGDAGRLSNLTILIAFIYLIYIVWRIEPVPYLKTLFRLPDRKVEEIAEWAKINTELNDVFLVDPNWSDFRPISQRPVFVTYKDGAAILWDKSYIEEWAPRMEALGYDFEKPQAIGISTSSYLQFVLRTLYGYLDDTRVRELARQYALSYWVVPVSHPSAFPVVFNTLDYKVLKIPDNP